MDLDRFAPLVACLHDPGPIAEKIQHAGTTVIGLDLPSDAGGQGRVARFLAFNRLLRLLRRFAPDIVVVAGEAFQALGRVAARIAGVPIIVGTHRRHRGGAWRPGFLDRHGAKAVDAIVAPTRALADEAVRLEGVSVDRVHVIPNVVEFAEVRGKERAEDLLEPKFRAAVLTRLEAGRGIDTIIEAAAFVRDQVPELEWIVCGTGADPIPFLRAAQRRGVEAQVKFPGERDHIGEFLAGIDLLVAPADCGGQSVAVLEALAAGVPVLAARNPSLAETVDADAIAYFEPGDAKGLAAEATRLFTDHAARARLAAAGRRTSARFRLEASVIAWHDLFAALASAALARAGLGSESTGRT